MSDERRYPPPPPALHPPGGLAFMRLGAPSMTSQPVPDRPPTPRWRYIAALFIVLDAVATVGAVLYLILHGARPF